MISINITGSYSKINAKQSILKHLFDYFSVDSPGARFSDLYRKKKWDGKIHFFNKIGNTLPTGLVPLVEKLYEDSVQITDHRKKPSEKWIRKKLLKAKKLNLIGRELSDFQREAILQVPENPIGIIKVATNGGKTTIGSAIIKLLKKKTLYVIHRKTLLHQVAKEIEELTGYKCGKIGSGVHEVGELVTVAMVQSLPNPSKKCSDFYNQFDLLIMDETQHGSAKTWNRIAMFMRAPFKYGMSGTPWTGKSIEDLKLISVFGPNILIEVKNQELIDRGWSAKPTVHIWKSKSPRNLLKWRSAYHHMIVDNSKYNELVLSIVKDKFDKGYGTMVLVNQIPHGLRLQRRLTGEGIDCKFLTGSTPDEVREKQLQRFKDGKLGVIVASTIFDEGVSVPAIKCLVLAGGGKARVTLLQRVGRALRKKREGENTAEIHDFKHIGNRYLEEHYKERLKIYREEGFKIVRHKRPSLSGIGKYHATGEPDWHRLHEEGNR